MIKFIKILKENKNSPKAIFLAGPAGSGKSYMSKQVLPQDFTIINVDDAYTELLKTNNLGLKQKDFTSDQLSQAAKLMGKAQKITREKYIESLKNLKNVIIDGTGASSKPLIKKK